LFSILHGRITGNNWGQWFYTVGFADRSTAKFAAFLVGH